MNAVRVAERRSESCESGVSDERRAKRVVKESYVTRSHLGKDLLVQVLDQDVEVAKARQR